MRCLFIFLLSILFSVAVLAQSEKVKGTLSSRDTADLTILNIYPESFPELSVVFRAEKKNGEPVWNLTKQKMLVKENDQSCKVISLEQISQSKPIYLGIVIDHSGSMMQDQAQLFDKNGKPLFSMDANNQVLLPQSYVAPIEHAKSAVKDFVASFNAEKDYISITGFSSSVDKKLALTQNTATINAVVDSMQADESTALYDAMLSSIGEVTRAKGIRVLVVLTDGQDNFSKSSSSDVVRKAQEESVPIYLIGLGDVNKEVLSSIADSTKGKFYYTGSSVSLRNIYADVSKQVQAYYNLVYASPNFSSADNTREIELSFDVDSMVLISHAASSDFPIEVVEFMAQKETEKDYFLFGGIATVFLVAGGTLLFSYKRKRNRESTLRITSLFPNPSAGNITVNYTGGEGELQIINLQGIVMKTLGVTGTEASLDISELEDGSYLAVILGENFQSNAVPFILNH